MPIALCRICHSSSIQTVHEFSPIPYGDLYQPNPESALAMETSELILVRCESCGLLQLKNLTKLEDQYSDYLYFSSVTHNLLALYKRIAKRLIDYTPLLGSDLILDIGSNDGSFLECFSSKTLNLFGVDPSLPACTIARRKGLTIDISFFDFEFVTDFLNKHERPKLITCNYTIANVPDLDSFFTSIRMLMSKETLFNLVTGYHLDQFQVGMFDYINHDHHTYLTLHDLQFLATKHGMKLLYFYRHEHKGGSVEVGISLIESEFQVEESIFQNLQREEWLKHRGNGQILRMVDQISENSEIVSSILDGFDSKRSKTVGIGASISTTSLISEFHLQDRILVLYDDDERKALKYAPGSGIAVRPMVEVSNLEVGAVAVIASWQHSNRLIQRLKDLGFAGNILIPMPHPKILSL